MICLVKEWTAKKFYAVASRVGGKWNPDGKD